MEYRPLGQLQVSVVGLGCNNFGMTIDAEQTARVVDAALEAGINYFDTAEMYGNGQSEEFLGRPSGRRGRRCWSPRSGATRASPKEGEHGGDPALVRRSLEASLRRLGTDYVDHYMLHRPDPDTPQEETLGVLAELRARGQDPRDRLQRLQRRPARRRHPRRHRPARSPPYASVQNHYSLLTREPERAGVLEACARDDLAFVPYFPLESGLLTGKYRAGEPLPEDSRLRRWGERARAFIDDDKLATVGRLEPGPSHAITRCWSWP